MVASPAHSHTHSNSDAAFSEGVRRPDDVYTHTPTQRLQSKQVFCRPRDMKCYLSDAKTCERSKMPRFWARFQELQELRQELEERLRLAAEEEARPS